MTEPEFNNRFITAIALFLEHKNFNSHLPRDNNGKLISDLRLYVATDHLYDMEIPINLPKKLVKRLGAWREKCFKHRLDNFKKTEIPDSLFKEGEDFLAEIDRVMFKTSKVVMRYR